MVRKSFYILSCGFTFSTLNFKFYSTNVECSLQINLFMQNKANFRKSQVNVNKEISKDYEKMDTWSSGKKQSQTNPNKAKLKKAKMNVTSIITKAYENKPPILAPKKQSQISKRQKPMQTLLTKRIMKKTRFWAPKKQTQFKPNLSRRSLWRSRKQTQFQTNLGLLKLVSTSRMIKSYLNIVGSPCVIAGKTRLTIRKDPPGISHAKTGNRVRFGIDKMGLKMYDNMIEFCCEMPFFKRCGYGFSKK